MGRRRARAWHGRSKRGDAVLHLATAHGESTRTPRCRAAAWHGDPDRGHVCSGRAAAASTGEIKQEVLRANLSRLERGLAKLTPLRSSATGIETEVSRIRGDPYEIEVELRGALGELAVLAAW
jgi:hypothetical protein